MLGIIQGLTEWFPVSSSGHLVLYQELFTVNVPVLFDIYLHLGTLLVLFIFFWTDLVTIIRDVFQWNTTSKHFTLAKQLLLATIVTAVIGFLFRPLFTSFFTNLLMVGFGFLFSGCLLLATKYTKHKRTTMKPRDTFSVGLFQGLALIPGVSRSGATISIGLLHGIDRMTIARFSFLLAIPAILGAAIFESITQLPTVLPFFIANSGAVLIGVLASAVTGYICLAALMNIIKKGNIHFFAIYCFIIGIITLGIAIL